MCIYGGTSESVNLTLILAISYPNINIHINGGNHVIVRWTTIGWPHKIEVQMEQTQTQLEEDEERFHKLQLTDQANFNDKLDTLSVCHYEDILPLGLSLLPKHLLLGLSSKHNG